MKNWILWSILLGTLLLGNQCQNDSPRGRAANSRHAEQMVTPGPAEEKSIAESEYWTESIVAVSPLGPFEIHSYQSFEISLTPKSTALQAETAILFIVTPYWGWSKPQITEPHIEGYTSVSCSNPNVQLEIHQVNKYTVMVRVLSGTITPEDKLNIIYGNATGNEGKARVDRFAETASPFFLKISPDGSEQFYTIRETPSIQTIAHQQHLIRAVAPTMVQANIPFTVKVAVTDYMNNRNRKAQCSFRITEPARNMTLGEGTIAEKDDGWTQISLVLKEHGWHHLSIESSSDGSNSLLTSVNPILCTQHKAETNIYWGDIHGHSAMSDGTGTPDEYFEYAREIAGLDFCSLTDHDAFGFIPLDAINWQCQLDRIKNHHKPGEFVIFPAYEWTSWIYGHRNVYFKSPNSQVFSSSNQQFDTLPELWNALKKFESMTIPHHVAGGPIAADWSQHNPEFEPVVEICSVHGSSESWNCPGFIYNPQKGSTVRDALDRGYKLGIFASSDCHDGHPGIHPRGQTVRGLIAARAEDLTRENIWQAIRRRAVYGTSGVRMYLSFEINNYPMGSIISRHTIDDINIVALAVGEEYMEEIILVKNGKEILRKSGHEYEASLTLSEVKEEAGDTYYYVRAKQMDGQMSWSSPIWIVPG